MSHSKKPEVADQTVLQLLSDLNIFNWSLSGSFDTIKNLSKAKVKYSDGTKLDLGTSVTYSNVGQPTQSSVPAGSTANNQPISVKVKDPECKGSYFSIFMLDPDAEDRTVHQLGPFLHWALINIPICKSKCKKGYVKLDLDSGFVVGDYFTPAATINSGLHRYTFVVYKQSCKVDTTQIPYYGNDTNYLGKFWFFADTFISAYMKCAKMELWGINYFNSANVDSSDAGQANAFINDITAIVG
jgi:phosphatidylethanolamine-binding protein (PEBP) family uncharacterized protein